jgi:Zn-dependent protease with chaperone function
VKNRQFKKLRRRIERIAAKWKLLLANHWRFTYVFLKKPNKLVKGHGNWICYAATAVNWEYLDATIYFNMRQVRRMTKDELEEIIVHEMTHALVNEMRDWTIKNEERVVTTIAWAFLKVRRQGQSPNN